MEHDLKSPLPLSNERKEKGIQSGNCLLWADGLFVNIRTGTLELSKVEQQNKGRISISNVKFLQNLATKVCEVKRFGGMEERRKPTLNGVGSCPENECHTFSCEAYSHFSICIVITLH